MLMYIGICVMLFGGGAFIAFFSRLLITLLEEGPVNPDKVMLFSIIWAVILVVGVVLTVIGYFAKKKQAAAPAVTASAPAATAAVETAVETVVEDAADAASTPVEDAAEQPQTPEEI